MTTLRLLTLLSIAGLLLSHTTPSASAQTLAYTGHTYAAIDPCDCPVAPNGSLARRSELLTTWRKTTPGIALIDAGFNTAGSAYDIHTAGKERDQARQALVWRSMKHMGYHAMVPGKDEWDQGLEFLAKAHSATGIPWISLTRHTRHESILPWIDTPENNLRITALHPDKGWRDALTHYWAKATTAKGSATSHVLVLHGERAFLTEVQTAFPRFSVIIWATPQGVNQPAQRLGQTTVITCSDEGKSLGRVDWGNTDTVPTKTAHHELHDGYENDPLIAAWVKEFHQSDQPGRARLDMFLPALLDQGADTVPVLDEVIRRATNITYDVRLIPNGPTPTQEGLTMIQHLAAIRIQHPAKTWSFITRRLAHPEESVAQSLMQLGLTLTITAETKQAIEKVITEDTQYRQRHGIAHAPALVINHRRYSAPMKAERILSHLCRLTAFSRGHKTLCDTLPDCYVDYDCHKPGVIGRCAEPGRHKAHCETVPAHPVTTLIIRPSHSLSQRHEQVIKQLAFFVPGMRPTLLTAHDEQAIALIKDHTITRLPAFIFSHELKRTQRFHMLQAGLIQLPAKKGYLFKADRINANVHINRPLKHGTITLVMSPRSPLYREIIQQLAAAPDLRTNIHWLPLITGSDALPVSPLGLADFEDAQRLLAVQQQYPKRFWDYAIARADRPQSTYWQRPLEAAQINPESLRIEPGAPSIERARAHCQSLEQDRDFLLIHNQEIIPLRPGMNLVHLLKPLH